MTVSAGADRATGLDAGELAGALAAVDAARARLRPADPTLAAWFDDYARDHRRRLAEDLVLVTQRVGTGDRVLEVGSVPLLLTAALAGRGFDVTGVDLDPERFRAGIDACGLAVVRCDVETEALPFADASFDAVVCNEVFEHLRVNPVFTVREINRVLRPGGRLMLSTPNLRSYRGVVNLVGHGRAWSVGAEPYEQYAKLERLGHMGHVREYTRREVEDFLAACGLTVTEVVPRGAPATRLEHVALRLRPSLAPMMSVVAEKAGGSGP